MGLKIKFERPPVPPKPEPKEESIFDALKLFQEGRKGTLMLVHRDTGASYRVLAHDPKTGRTTLKNSENKKLHPMLTEREARIYKPYWR